MTFREDNERALLLEFCIWFAKQFNVDEYPTPGDVERFLKQRRERK